LKLSTATPPTQRPLRAVLGEGQIPSEEGERKVLLWGVFVGKKKTLRNNRKEKKNASGPKKDGPGVERKKILQLKERLNKK